MQLALHPYVTAASVAVIGAGLIQVTPVATPRLEQRPVVLTAAEALSDLIGPTDAAVGGLGGLSAELASVLPNAGDLSGTFAGAASRLELLDPTFWQEFLVALLHPGAGESPWLMLIGAIEQLPVIGPLLEAFGLFVVFPVSLLAAYLWSLISPASAAAEGLASGLQGVDGTALAGVIDPALAAEAGTPLGDITSLFGDAAGAFDPTSMVQDVSTALDPSAVTSIVDLNAIVDVGTAIDPAAVADVATAIDPAAIADIGTALSLSIPGVAEILAGLAP